MSGINIPASPMPMPQPAAVPTPAALPEENKPLGQDFGNIMFEDIFPPLDLDDEEKVRVANWLITDLEKCVKNVNRMIPAWAEYRAVYLLKLVNRFFPFFSGSAEFSAGLLCEKMLEGMDRMRLGIYTPRPLFLVDDRTSNIEEMNFTHRAEWFLHTVFMEDLDVQRAIGLDGLFEFLLDGSLIVEADNMYEKIPQRKLKTIASLDELILLEDKILNRADFEEAFERLSDPSNEDMPRILIEEDVLTKNGLQIFMVDKIDHLVPPNVFKDSDIRFRGRRMYLTENDLRLMASENVGWYKQKDVDNVLATRATLKGEYSTNKSGSGKTGEPSKDSLSPAGNLSYNWRMEVDKLGIDQRTAPYENMFAVYRVTAKYGYKTGSDKEGLIPKFCVFDVEPESRTILRATVYPRLNEQKKSYFHFKLGVAPKSYWGFGFGQRLLSDDSLVSNSVNLTLEGAAMATYKPILSVSPEFDGLIPFQGGLGAGKIGYVRQVSDVQPLEIPPPSMTLVNTVVSLVESRASNRTSVTPLSQGRAESSDPRSPAAKTAMLLKEASVGMSSMIMDWNLTWNEMAEFVWESMYEKAIYEGVSSLDDKIVFPGMYRELEGTNTITIEELAKNIKWKSQASSEYFNAEGRVQAFLRSFQFFMPQLQLLAQFNVELFKKYFVRWMNQAALVMNLPNMKYLIPTPEELAEVAPEQLMNMLSDMSGQLQNGQSPGMLNVSKKGGAE